MDIHLKRFLWYYRVISNKDLPEPEESIIVSHDSIALAGIDYWKFIYTIRKLVEEGYLVRGYRRRYFITEKLVKALRMYNTQHEISLHDKIKNLFLSIYYLTLSNPNFKSQLMMTFQTPNEKELAELLKKMYEVMESVNERLGIILKRLEDLKQDLKKNEMSDMQDEIGRVVVDTK